MLTACCVAQAGVRAEPRRVLQDDLDQPTDVAVRDDGRVYVLDGVNGRVVVFTAGGERDFEFARPGSAPGELQQPVGIAIGAGRVFIADTQNHRIAVFGLRGDFVRNIALPGEPPAEPVALTVSEGRLWWTDRRHHRLCAYDLAAKVQRFCLGKRGEGRRQFRFPFQIGVDDSGYLYVTDVLNGRIQVLHPRGRFVYDMARFGLAPGELFRPNGLAFSSDGLLLVGDSYRGDITLFRDGQFVGRLRDGAGRALHFRVPVGITVHGGQLYVVDAGRNRVEVFRLLADGPGNEPQTPPPRRPAASRKHCIGCHVSWAPGPSPGRAQAAPQAGETAVPAVASSRMCYSCHHGVVVDSRRRIGRGGQHPDVHHPRKKRPPHGTRAKKREDKIAPLFPLREDPSGGGRDGGSLTCGTCHTPHGPSGDGQATLYAAHDNPWMRVPNRDGDLCQRCHASKLASHLDPKHPPRGVNHPVGIYLKVPPEEGKRDRRAYASEPRLRKGLPERLADKGATLGGQKQMLCQTCHQIHGGEGDAMTVLPVSDAGLCIECHPRQHAAGKKAARKKGIHPVDFKLDEAVKIAGKRFERVTCLTCHGVHDGVPGTPLLREDHRDGRLCGHCHEGRESVVDSDHDLRRTAKDNHNLAGQSPADSGVCGACHRMHRGKAGEPVLHAWERHEYKGRERPLARDTLCLDCHRQKGIAASARVSRFGHPARDLVLRSDVKRMPLIGADGRLGEFGAIGCVTCHDPHRWAPRQADGVERPPKAQAHRAANRDGNVLDSFLRQRGVKDGFCVDCHGIEAPRKYKYYHDSRVRDRGVDYLE